MATSRKTSIAYTDELSVNLRISRYIPEPLDGFSVTVRGVLQPIMQASLKLKNTFKKIMAVVAQSSTGYEELDNFMFSFCIIFLDL